MSRIDDPTQDQTTIQNHEPAKPTGLGLMKYLEHALEIFPDANFQRYMREYLRIKDMPENETLNETRITLLIKIVKNLGSYATYSKDKSARYKAKAMKVWLLSSECKRYKMNNEMMEKLLISFPEIIEEDEEYEYGETEDHNTNRLIDMTNKMGEDIKNHCVKMGMLWKNPGVGKALADRVRASSYLTPISFGFPEVEWEAEQDKVLDPNLPTIVFQNFGKEALSRARALDKKGVVNVVIATDTQLKDKRRSRILEGIVYKGGKLYLVPFTKGINPNYIAGADKQWSEEYQDIPFIGSGITSNMSNDKDAFLVANFDGENHSDLLIPGNYRTEERRKGRINGGTIIDTPEDKNDPELRMLPSIRYLFLANPDLKKCVLKPRRNTNGGFGVWILHRSEIMKCDDRAYEKLRQKVARYLPHVDSVSVEPFVEPYPISINGEVMDWNIRVYVTRDEQGNLTVEKGKVVRYGPKDTAINISNGGSATDLEKLRDQIPEFNSLTEQVDRISIAQIGQLLELAKKIANNLSVKMQKNIEIGATDQFSVDIIITKDSRGNLVPVTIEFDSWNAGCLWNGEQATDPAEWSKFSDKIVNRMIMRAKEHFKLAKMRKECGTSLKETIQNE